MLMNIKLTTLFADAIFDIKKFSVYNRRKIQCN